MLGRACSKYYLVTLEKRKLEVTNDQVLCLLHFGLLRLVTRMRLATANDRVWSQEYAEMGKCFLMLLFSQV